MTDKAFESEELRVFHKACREGKALEIANANFISPDLLNTRSVVTGRTVSISTPRAEWPCVCRFRGNKSKELLKGPAAVITL